MKTRRWTVEHTWLCSTCEYENLGRFLTCQHCGKPKSGEAYDEHGAEHKPAVTDEKALAEARRGRNWICSYCQGDNRGNTSECSRCGADRDGHKVRESSRSIVRGSGGLDVQMLEALRSTPHASGPVPSDLPIEPEKKFTGGDYRTAPQVEEIPSPPKSVSTPPAWTGVKPDGDELGEIRWAAWRNWRSHRKALGIGGGVAVAAGLLLWLGLWLFLPWEEHVRVEARSWTRSIELQQRITLSGSGWDDDRPASHFDDRCETRQHGTHDCNPYDCNPHSVSCNCHSVRTGESCHTSCSSGGNGFSSCEQVCSPTYRTECDSCTEYDTCWRSCPTWDQWCTYQYYDWPTIRTERSAGQGEDVVVWPNLVEDVNPPSPQRLVRHENYKIIFRNDSDAWELKPSTAAEYARYQLHARWTIEVNHAGAVRPLHLE